MGFFESSLALLVTLFTPRENKSTKKKSQVPDQPGYSGNNSKQI